MSNIINFKVGDKFQYNKKYLDIEVVEILQIMDKYCLVLFISGFKLCTTLSGLYPLQNKN
jgi:hypothetical protein